MPDVTLHALEQAAILAHADLRGQLRPPVFRALCGAWVAERIAALGLAHGWENLPADLRRYRVLPA